MVFPVTGFAMDFSTVVGQSLKNCNPCAMDSSRKSEEIKVALITGGNTLVVFGVYIHSKVYWALAP